MQWRVIVGTLSFIVMAVFTGFVAVTEQDRMASFTTSYDARQVEAGAALFENNCKNCHGDQGLGIEGVGPALNAIDLFNGTRLAEMSYAGTVKDYVRSTISSGRPRASAAFATFPQRMPTWGDENGGPLRKDQVDALTAYVMNWGNAFEGQTAGPAVVIDAVGADISIELPAGDAKNGEAITNAKGCVACHIAAAVGPAWLASADANGQGVGTRAETRFSDPAYAGAAKDAQHYLFEAIVQPNAFLVTGFQPNVMPQTYGNSLTKQDVADLIAYLQTVK